MVTKNRRTALKAKPKPKAKNYPANKLNEAIIYPVPGRKANWILKKVRVRPGAEIQWFCGKQAFKIWFPDNRNPLVGSNQVTGVDGYAKAQVRSDVIAKEHYSYCVLATDPKGHVHLAVGNSPPDMEIV